MCIITCVFLLTSCFPYLVCVDTRDTVNARPSVDRCLVGKSEVGGGRIHQCLKQEGNENEAER